MYYMTLVCIFVEQVVCPAIDRKLDEIRKKGGKAI